MPAKPPTSKSRLTEYRRKRNFQRTPEPAGAASKRKPPADQTIFVIQKHLASRLHYDLRLEHAGVLLSWAVPKGPSLNPADKRMAVRVEDHPSDYAEFEGVIPEGYGAGVVLLWDRGTWTPDSATPDVDAALAKGELKFTLTGEKLNGGFVLVRLRPRPGESAGRNWLLIKHRDAHATDADITATAPRSVKSQGDFADILVHESPRQWHSHGRETPAEPSGGGASGGGRGPNRKLMAQVLAEAAAIKTRREKSKARQTPKQPPRAKRSKTTRRPSGRGKAKT